MEKIDEWHECTWFFCKRVSSLCECFLFLAKKSIVI